MRCGSSAALVLFSFFILNVESLGNTNCIRALVGPKTSQFNLSHFESRAYLLRSLFRAVAAEDTAYDSDAFLSQLDPLVSHCGSVAFSICNVFGGTMRSGRLGDHRGIFNVFEGEQTVDLTRGQYPGYDFDSISPPDFSGVRHFKTKGNRKMKKFLKRAESLAKQIWEEILKTHTQLSQNAFPTDRGIYHRGKRDRKSYSDFFDSHLESALTKMGPRSRVLDVGGGELWSAQDFFLHGHRGKYVAVNVVDPETNSFQKNLATLGDRKNFRYLSGRGFEDISNEEVGRANLIFDVYGALTYSINFDFVLNKYLALLPKGGKIFTVLRSGSVVIQDYEGHSIELLDFLNSVPGIRAEKIGEFAIILEKIKTQVRLPSLRLLAYLARDEKKKRWVPKRTLEISR